MSPNTKPAQGIAHLNRLVHGTDERLSGQEMPEERQGGATLLQKLVVHIRTKLAETALRPLLELAQHAGSQFLQIAWVALFKMLKRAITVQPSNIVDGRFW